MLATPGVTPAPIVQIWPNTRSTPILTPFATRNPRAVQDHQTRPDFGAGLQIDAGDHYSNLRRTASNTLAGDQSQGTGAPLQLPC